MPRRAPLRPQTINSHLHLLSEILACAVREGLLARNPAEGEDVRLEVRRGKEGVAGSSPAEGFIGTLCSWRVSGFRALIGSGLTRALGCCAVCGLRDGDRVKLPGRTLLQQFSRRRAGRQDRQLAAAETPRGPRYAVRAASSG